MYRQYDSNQETISKHGKHVALYPSSCCPLYKTLQMQNMTYNSVFGFQGLAASIVPFVRVVSCWGWVCKQQLDHLSGAHYQRCLRSCVGVSKSAIVPVWTQQDSHKNSLLVAVHILYATSFSSQSVQWRWGQATWMKSIVVLTSWTDWCIALLLNSETTLRVFIWAIWAMYILHHSTTLSTVLVSVSMKSIAIPDIWGALWWLWSQRWTSPEGRRHPKALHDGRRSTSEMLKGFSLKQRTNNLFCTARVVESSKTCKGHWGTPVVSILWPKIIFHHAEDSTCRTDDGKHGHTWDRQQVKIN